VAAAGSASLAAQVPGSVRWRLRTQYGRGHDLVVASLALLAERLSAMTAGRFRLDVETRDDGTSRSPLFDAVRGGEFDAVHLDASTLVENDPLFAFLGAIPYGMTARQHDAWLRHGNGLATLRPALQRHGVVVFPAGGTGVEMGGWYRREIKGTADLKELKVRSFGVGAGVLARLGVAVQRMPDGEVPAALQAGRLDGAVGAGPYDDERQGWYKSARFYYYPLATGGGHQFVVLVRAEAWAALPADLKAAFEAACTDAGQDVAARYGAQTPRALRQLLANGVQLRPFPPEVARAGYAAAEEALAAAGGGNEEFRQVHTAWRAFRDDQLRAFGLADSRNAGLLHSLVVAPGAAAAK
jgi:TRAP-type mannitol/chloroaromatic compound transport system substrate-binding protein